jgi:murein DD-endopeptidase MepM/ murein hydrolase activator NlpD
VKPPKSVQKRIRKEFAQAKRIYTRTTPISYIAKPFVLPLRSLITSHFGTARIFNGLLKSYHSGVDFKAKVGTPVRAINDGMVVLAKKRYYAGGSVIIDHGRGIYSCYYHLSRFKVKPGEFVRRGEIIGLSGKSGRVTGPHLHLTIKIKNVTVDPIQFIKAFNHAFRKKPFKTAPSPLLASLR